MYDINTLPSILTSTDSEYTIKGSYAFLEETYQRYFGRKYLTDELVKNEPHIISYSVSVYNPWCAITSDYLN